MFNFFVFCSSLGLRIFVVGVELSEVPVVSAFGTFCLSDGGGGIALLSSCG